MNCSTCNGTGWVPLGVDPDFPNRPVDNLRRRCDDCDGSGFDFDEYCRSTAEANGTFT